MKRVIIKALAFVLGFSSAFFGIRMSYAEGTVAAVAAPTYTYTAATSWRSMPQDSTGCYFDGATASTVDGVVALWMNSTCKTNSPTRWTNRIANTYSSYFSSVTVNFNGPSGGTSGVSIQVQPYTCPSGYQPYMQSTGDHSGCEKYNAPGTLMCPANSANLVSGNCTCNVGFDPAAGACVPRSCPAVGSPAGSQAEGFTTTNRYLGWRDPSITGVYRSFGGGTKVACQNGCKVTTVNALCVGVSSQNSTDMNCALVDPAYDGTACTGTENPSGSMAVATPRTTELTCAAQGKASATINGVTTCSEASLSTPVTTVSGSSTTNAAGTSSDVTTTTDKGGSVTQTKTNTSPSGTVTTETKETPKDSFCEQNPNSPICKAKDPCEDAPNRLSCAEFGEVADTPLTTKSVGTSSITPVAVSSSMSCPASVALPKGLTFDYGPMCTYAGALRPIVLALAWLAAGLILFGAFKES